MHNLQRSRLAAVRLTCLQPFRSVADGKMSVHGTVSCESEGLPLVDDAHVHASVDQRVRAHHAGGTGADDEDVDIALLYCR